MLTATKPKSNRIDRIVKEQDALILYSEKGMHRIRPVKEGIVQITYTEKDVFSGTKKPGVVCNRENVNWDYEETSDTVCVKAGGLVVYADKKTASYRYEYHGKTILQERSYDSKELEEFQAYELDDDRPASTMKVQTADGEKTVVTEAGRRESEKLFHTKLHLEWQEREALFGLGQQEEGVLNLRGHVIYLHQANRKIAVPMLVSSMNYGILMDSYSPMIFRDDANGSYLYTEADEELDYYFIAAQNADEVIKGYRYLTGKASMLPKWAYGYIQSQERYESQQEILDMAEQYRDRQIGLDALVLDWCSWEDNMWGQKSVDRERFPNLKEMTDRLHEQNIHFMISIWPNMDPKTANHKQMKEQGCMLPACDIYNALSEKARRLYWQQADEGLFQYGVDAWWCDSSEPLTVEWEHNKRMDPAVLYAEYCRRLPDHIPTKYTNAFGLYHAQTMYEGQRSSSDEKRVCNLTRSTYTGGQRYGTIMWSGDISASWDTYRKQIANGLSFCASGLPYWTVDIGAFFVKKGNVWFWDGEYDEALQDAGYRELFTRWYQWGAFLPVFRGHGTDCRRELWQFEDEEGLFYDALMKANRLRYQLLPYIYSQAGKVWAKDESMMRMLPLVFPQDEQTLSITDEYMFGESILVCPVTEPMYYESGNRKLKPFSYTKIVYLPKGCGWYDYWTGKYYIGGHWVETEAPIDKIPLFIREGSVIPMASDLQYAKKDCEVTFYVYAGKDCEYEYYEDAGDSYRYEKGEYTLTCYRWSEEEQMLARNGEAVEQVVVIHK